MVTIEFTQEMADRICDRLAEGRSLRSVSQDKDTIGLTTVFKWLNTNEAFARQYARATELRAEMLFDDIQNIVDAPYGPAKKNENGDTVDTTEVDTLEHRRMKIDARKWMIGKMAPKKYGDKSSVDVDLSGKIETSSRTDDRLKAALALMMAREAKE